MEKTLILIPGANPEAAKPIFSAIRESFENSGYEILELQNADEEELAASAKGRQHKILVGKSNGARIAIYHQLEFKGAEALVLLAPAVEPSEEFKKISIPVLIVHGTEDPVIPVENSRRLRNIFKDCKLDEIENTDHSFRKKEKETARVIADWIFSI
jgi:predicted esterase